MFKKTFKNQSFQEFTIFKTFVIQLVGGESFHLLVIRVIVWDLLVQNKAFYNICDALQWLVCYALCWQV